MRFHWSYLVFLALAGALGAVMQCAADHNPHFKAREAKIRKLDEHCAAVHQALVTDAADLTSDRPATRETAIDRFDGQHGQRSDLEIHLCTGRWPSAERDACWMRRDAACLARIAEDLTR